MSFTNGFEKIAYVEKEAFLSAGMNIAKGMGKRVMTAGRSFLPKAQPTQDAARQARMGFGRSKSTQEVGANLASKRGAGQMQGPVMPGQQSLQDQVKQKAQADVLARKSRMDNRKNWFQKNPIKTTVGGFYAANKLFGSGEQPPQPPPQVVQY
jgi:hypothetical protein